MKIKCQFCDAMIDDTLAKCPNCGAPNPNVVRTTKDQPQTIEELKEWYANHGLPPFETTRFFIGINYEKPRAFGIYKDEKGNFVVYKNKDNGQRAVRYEGTDEAYAVNELFMRLKQEIIEQKSNNLKKGGSSTSSNAITNNQNAYSDGTAVKKFLLKALGIGVLFFVCFFGFCFAISYFDESPSKGYYSYNNESYYYFPYTEKWFDLDDTGKNWSESPLYENNIPEDLKVNKTAKQYYLSYDWKSDLNLPNFENSVYYIDYSNKAEQGYYRYNNKNYYNLNGNYLTGWYLYDSYDDWTYVDESDLPDDLKHYSTSQDFYYTPTWDPSTQVTDFSETAIYKEYEEQQSSSESSSSDDYSWDSSDSWDSDSTDWGSDW